MNTRQEITKVLLDISQTINEQIDEVTGDLIYEQTVKAALLRTSIAFNKVIKDRLTDDNNAKESINRAVRSHLDNGGKAP